jgi:hypothetical protein
MPAAFFQVRLSVQPSSGGEAELILPGVLQGLNYRFVIVKEGGEEGIIKLEEPDAVIEKVENACKKLAENQVETLQGSYPKPKIKKKFRMRAQTQGPGAIGMIPENFEVDDQGNRLVDSIQTVRSGFYLIDVPVLPPVSERNP